MMPYLVEHYGNASSVYSIARTAKRAIEEARGKVAAAIGAESREIYFTSCGTESDNWAIKGAAMRFASQGKKHIITSNFEHHAVLHTCEYWRNTVCGDLSSGGQHGVHFSRAG